MASRKLATYRAKRDFKHTAEPAGSESVVPSKHLRFAPWGADHRRQASLEGLRRRASRMSVLDTESCAGLLRRLESNS